MPGYNCLTTDWMQPGCTLGFFAVEKERQRERARYAFKSSGDFVRNRNEQNDLKSVCLWKGYLLNEEDTSIPSNTITPGRRETRNPLGL